MATKLNGTTPAWYQQVISHLKIQQSEIFVLSGDTEGYPVYPGETLVDFLKRQTLMPVRNRLGNEATAETIAQFAVVAEVSPAMGLTFSDTAQQLSFNVLAAPPEEDAWAAPQVGAGLTDAFNRLSEFFVKAERSETAPSLTLIVRDADLIFDADAPMVEPERTLLSHLRLWSEKPLINGDGNPHRIYLISSSSGGFRSALMGGRISPVKLPLPDEATRQRFVEKVRDAAADDGNELTYEEGLDDAGLARITGALNLTQVEDAIYQSFEFGTITRAIVQDRKDELVAQTYDGVIQVEYPTIGFDSLVGYDALKAYMQNYVYPKLRDGSPRCPKGCILTGPPGTGKTAFAKALAAALRLPLVIVMTDLIKNKFVGESNKNMAKLCEGIVALAPAIVLIDEIDKVMPSGDDSTGVSQEILGQLQTFMSDIDRGRAFFVATTNYPSRIPRALLRPGRFEQVIPMLPQHLDGLRGGLLQGLSTRMGFDANLKAAGWEKAGKDAIDYTGADAENLLIEADRCATEQGAGAIHLKHLTEALGYVVPTLASSQSMVDEALRFTSNRRYVPTSLQEQVGESNTSSTTTEDTPRRRRVRGDI